jgi:hypothetical protein
VICFSNGVAVCVISALRTVFVNIIYIYLMLRFQANPRDFILDTVALCQVFSPSTFVLSCQYHSTSAPESSSSTRCSYQDERAKTGRELSRERRSFGSRGPKIEKHLHFFHALKGYRKSIKRCEEDGLALDGHSEMCRQLLCCAQVPLGSLTGSINKLYFILTFTVENQTDQISDVAQSINL